MMILTIEDIQKDGSKTSDMVPSSTAEYKGSFDNKSLKTELAMVIKTEKTVEKIMNGKRDVCVDDIINRVKSCEIDVDFMTTDLSRVFGNLMLENKNDGEQFLKPRENGETETDREEDIVKKQIDGEADIPCDLVTLEPPSFDDDEEGEENEQLPQEEVEDNLEERGPVYGVPSSSVTQSRLAASYSCPSMPQNFPDYSIHNARTLSGKDSEEEVNQPQKYFRPQRTGIIETITSLITPGSALGAGVKSLKKISQVNQKEMSGVTVYASENISASSNSIFEIVLDEPICNPSNDFDYFQQKPSNILDHGSEEQVFQAAHAQMSMRFQNQQGCNQQYLLPPVGAHTTKLNFPNQMQTVCLNQDVKCNKRGSSDEASDGCGSPLYEMHTSPLQSPHLSPAVLPGSLPESTWLASPSNTSQCSVDSGVCSPLVGDHNVCFSQVHFPSQDIQGYYCSDQTVSDNSLSDYFNQHKEDLRDVLEVIDKDLAECFAVANPEDRIIAPKSVLERISGIGNVKSGLNSQNLQFAETTGNINHRESSSKRKDIENQPLNGVFKPTMQASSVIPSQLTVNHEGKVAKAPTPQKKLVPNPGQLVSVVVPADGVLLSPLLYVPKEDSVNKLSKPLMHILPKEPNKQVEKIADANEKLTNTRTQTKDCNAGVDGQLLHNLPVSGEKTASERKRINLARRLVAEISVSDLKYIDEDGDTCLHVAVCKGDKFLLQACLERLMRGNLSEMINVQNLQGQTPLYLAVSTNNAEMVQLLIENGADVSLCAESVTSAGISEKMGAIHCVCSKGENYLKTLKALINAPDINLNQVNSDGHTALNCAILAHGKMNIDGAQINSIPIIQALIQAGVDPNLQVQQSGKTAFMYALESRDLHLIESTFHLIEPSQLATVLKTRAYDGSSVHKIMESLKTTLSKAEYQRLSSCLKPRNARGTLGSSA